MQRSGCGIRSSLSRDLLRCGGPAAAGPDTHGRTGREEAGIRRRLSATRLADVGDPCHHRNMSKTAPVSGGLPRTAPRQGPLVLIAALVTVALWASAFIGIRGAGPHYDPGALALLRMAVGTAVLAIIAVRHGIRLPARRQWWLIAVWGVGWFCVYNLERAKFL